MACNCCGPTGCKCKIRTSKPDDEVESFETHPFSYGFNYKMRPWVNKDYPVPVFMTTWDYNFNQYVASNAVYSPDKSKLIYPGFYTINQSRPGISAEPYMGGWLVENTNGDFSARYGPNPQTIYPSMTVFYLEEKQDSINRECQLWIKYNRFDWNGNSYVSGDWSELEKIHSMKWDDPFEAEISIMIPGSKFQGGVTNGSPNSVELRYQCLDACSGIFNTEDGATWELVGAADWLTKTTVNFPLDYCESYGSFNGNASWTYNNCDLQNLTVNSKAEKIFFTANVSCGYGYGFTCVFTGALGYLCEAPPEPCVDRSRYECCGNIYGGYQIQPDGTTICGLLSQLPWSVYIDDIYNRHVISSKSLQLNGTWQNFPEEYKVDFNCSTYKGVADPYYLWKQGTITTFGV